MNYFIKNRITAYMLFAGLFIFGIVGLNKLSVSLMPQSSYPAISVIIEYPGVSPDKIETIITKPLEKIIKTVSGIETIESISEEGKSRINISFKLDADIKIAALNVREKIGLIRHYFPREVQDPVVVRYDPSDRPVIIATVDKRGSSLVEIRELAERRIKPKLQRIEGISEINIAGGLVREIHINIDRGKFEARALSFKDISPAVHDNNVSLPGGIVYSGDREYSVYTSCRFKTVREISDAVILQASQGSLQRLSDFSEVSSAYRDPDDIARMNGNERVTLYIHKAGDANTLDVCDQAREILLHNKYCNAKIIYNQAKYIKSAIDNVIQSCVWGILAVFVILYLFIRNMKIVLIVGLSIPVAMITAFFFMYFFKIGLNLMSLSGLALGAGMIVDNSIVITQAVYYRKKIDAGVIHREVSSVKNAIVSSTLVTIIVFFPIVFGNESAKRTYGDMAFTVTAALLISLMIALILIPAVLAEMHDKKKASGMRLAGPVKDAYLAVTGKIAPYKNMVIEKFGLVERGLIEKYTLFINYAFKHKSRLIYSVLALAGAALVLSTFIKSEFVDPASTGEFYVYLEFPTGTSLDCTDEAVKRAEQYIKTLGVAETITSKVEKWRGTLAIKFKDSISSKKDQDEYKDVMKKKLNGILRKYGAFAFITEADEVSARELNIIFIGNENKVLQNLAKVAARAVARIKGIEDCVLRFREGRPEYLIAIDKRKAYSSLLTPAQITDFFRTSVFGPVITKFIDEDREVDIRMRFKKEDRTTIEEILRYSIKNSAGEMVPAKEIAEVNDQAGPTKIWRKDGRRCVTITAKIGSLSYDEAVKKIDTKLTQIQFPSEYRYQYDENLKKMRENKKSMIFSIIIAIILIYMVLASQFESFRLPFIIMVTVPLAFIGVVIGLLLTFSTMSISVYIGMIALAGIVNNNGIILVNEINNGYESGKISLKNLEQYIKEVCFKRFRPVIMTASTTIIGCVPMLIKGGEGSNLWRPLSLTIVSGLAFSTVLTLVVVPVFSYYLYRSRLRGAQ